MPAPTVPAPAPPVPAASVLLGVFVRDISPMPDSAPPPMYAGLVLCLQQLHPVNSMPIPHAPIRLTKGILPIGIILPRVSPFTPRPQRAVSSAGAPASAGLRIRR